MKKLLLRFMKPNVVQSTNISEIDARNYTELGEVFIGDRAKRTVTVRNQMWQLVTLASQRNIKYNLDISLSRASVILQTCTEVSSVLLK